MSVYYCILMLRGIEKVFWYTVQFFFIILMTESMRLWMF